MRKIIRLTAAVLAAAVIQLYAAVGYYACRLPDSYYIPAGGDLSVRSFLPIHAAAIENPVCTAFAEASPTATEAVSLRLFGIIPIKTAELQPIETPMLLIGGQPFGIKLRMDGVMIVRTAAIDTASGSVCPAEQAGLLSGDIIQTVNHIPVTSNADLRNIISKSEGELLPVEYIRNEVCCTTQLTPVYSAADQCYTAGIWVRDSLAGVGTVTFYDAVNGTFGGLGHPICDADTGIRIPIAEGSACPVTISGLVPSAIGKPGMLQGTFLSGEPLGKLTINSPCGVFGRLSAIPDISWQPVPMAFKQEITAGDAEILCTIRDTKMCRCSVSIEEIDYTGTDSTKNMVLHITDEQLLSDCGGIVQGMSGSPILQNGKLVGAVTHVFVDDPTRGYGIFCENMYRTCISGT